MLIELLVVPECPNEQVARDLVKAAIGEAGVSASVSTQVIENIEDAQRRRFVGSPSILINGRDPFADPDASFGVACRVYPTPQGLAGTPSLEELVAAIRAAAY